MTQVTQNKRLDGENDFVIICFSKRSRSPPSRLGGIGSKTFWPVILKIPSERKTFPRNFQFLGLWKQKKILDTQFLFFFVSPGQFYVKKCQMNLFLLEKMLKKCFFGRKKNSGFSANFCFNKIDRNSSRWRIFLWRIFIPKSWRHWPLPAVKEISWTWFEGSD